MTPLAKTAPDARHAASWSYAETFVPTHEHEARARSASADLGLVPVSQGTAAALTFFADLIGARAVVEVGTGAGVSGLALLSGMAPDGILTSIDLEPEHQAAARKVFAAAGIVPRRARLIAGGALNVLPKLSDAAYDLVFVDGDPLEYVEYVDQAARLLRPGGLLVMEHAFAGGATAETGNEDDNAVIVREALAAIKDLDAFGGILLPVGDGLLVARRA